MFKVCNQATVILVRISSFPIYARFPYPLHVVWNKYHYRQHYILFGDDTRPPCSPWVNSVPHYVRPEVFHDVSLMYDRCCSGICLARASGLPVAIQWQSSVPWIRPQCTLECHWKNASVLPVVFQWSSSGFPVVFQCVPIMQINTGLPLGHHWVLASASVVPVASQCTCDSSGLPVCSNYAN